MTGPATGRPPFGERLASAVAARGPLCVGIDPHPELLAAWGLPDDADGLASFADAVVDALGGEIAVLKPQSAFFERHGPAGVAVLQRVLRRVGEAGALALLDVKRGDIGSTMAAYAATHLGEHAPLPADAITLSPYLGVGALAPALTLADRGGRGVFLLARTSNPDGAAPAGRAAARRPHRRPVGGRRRGRRGTVRRGRGGRHPRARPRPVPAARPRPRPGLGEQGAAPGDLVGVFGAAVGRVLPSTSRQVLRAGPDRRALRDAALGVRDGVVAALGGSPW